MLTIRPSSSRGSADHGWLKSKHTFSFADYFNPQAMGFRALRVINEDRIDAGTGFGTHPHRDMEIISYVVDGALEHKDSMGTTAIIRPGEVQRMTAGTGVRHSEYNHEMGKATHFLQIWIIPEKMGAAPGYAQKSFETELEKGGLVLTVSKEGRAGSISIAQDVDIYVSRPKTGTNTQHKMQNGRGAWLQVINGELQVNGEIIQAGDSVAVEDEEIINIEAMKKSEFLLFDLGPFND